MTEIREAIEETMVLFDWKHLPEDLHPYSRPFQALAHDLYGQLIHSYELLSCLRRLLEAKDCAVRTRVLEQKGILNAIRGPDSQLT